MFKDYVDIYKNVNIANFGWYTALDWDDVNEETRALMRDDGYEPEDGSAEWIPVVDAEVYGVEHALHSGSSWDYDEDEAAESLLTMLKEAPYYLIMAHNCRWNSASSYKMVTKIVDTVKRGYDVTIYPKQVSKGGKCLIKSEHSHDVPMGARTSIIALTEKEYYALLDADFYGVSKFAERCEGSCA